MKNWRVYKYLYNRLDRLFQLRTLESRQLQSNLDWFRFATLSELHRLNVPNIDSANEIVDRLAKEKPANHQILARKYYSKELERILKSVEKQTNGNGVVDVYPPALESMHLGSAPSGERILQQATDQQILKNSNKKINQNEKMKQKNENSNGSFERNYEMNENSKAMDDIEEILSSPNESRLLHHPDGFQLVIQKSSIQHEAAGYGVFLYGKARAGQLLALYPGRLFAPPQLTNEIIDDNEYMLSFSSGWVVDGRSWHRRGERFESRLSKVIQGGVAAPESVNALLKYRNPLGIANYINHPPPNTAPNVMCCELELPKKFIDESVVKWLPNDLEPPTGYIDKYVWHNADGIHVRVMAAISLQNIDHGSELFMNYRFNPKLTPPDWYWDPDPEASARRWGHMKVL